MARCPNRRMVIAHLALPQTWHRPRLDALKLGPTAASGPPTNSLLIADAFAVACSAADELASS